MDVWEQVENLKVFSVILGFRLVGLGKIFVIKLKLLDGYDFVLCDVLMLKREEKNYYKKYYDFKVYFEKIW